MTWNNTLEAMKALGIQLPLGRRGPGGSQPRQTPVTPGSKRWSAHSTTTSWDGQEACPFFYLETMGGEALGAIGATTCCREGPRGQGLAAASGRTQEEAGCFRSQRPATTGSKVQAYGASQTADCVAAS
eukprot:4109501-Amphidinium_carterae.2